MIARSRPEVRFREIAKAWSPVPRDLAETLRAEFARALLHALRLEGEPVLVPSGRAALYLLFRAISLERVYLPAYTCWVVLEAARLAGKEVAFLDIEYPSLNVRVEQLRRIRDRPGIVVATHQFGYPEDVGRISDCLAGKEHVVIEDCAGAMCCSLRGSPLGSGASAALFSFETGKLLTLGGGGLIVTRDAALAQRIRNELVRLAIAGGRGALRRLLVKRVSTASAIYRWLLPLYLLVREPTEGMHALSETLTLDYREDFTNLQARLGVLLVARLDEIVRRRRALFGLYEQAMRSLPGLTAVESLPSSIITPIRYPFLVPRAAKRAIYDGLRARGVDLGFSYSYSLGNPGDFPDAARFAAEVLNLPLYADLPLAHAERAIAGLQAVSSQIL